MLSEEAAELPFAVGAAVYPPLPLADWSNTAAYAISAGTQHPEAAWRWLAFVGAQGDETGSIPPGAITVPARPSVAEQQGYWETLERATSLPGIAEAARAAIANPPHRGASDRYSQLLTITAAQVLDAGAAPTQALAAAQQRLEERRAQAPPLADASSGDAPIVVAPPRVAAPGAAPIRFHVYEWDNPQALQALADRFHQEHPDIFVQIVIVQPQQLGNGQTTFSLSALAAGADCFPWSSPPHQSDLELLIDLQPLIDADRAFDLGDYPAAIVSRFQRNGGLYGLPSIIRFSHVLEYNPTAFDAAGLAYPRADWTIDDFLLAAQRLTQGSGEQRSYGFASIDWQPEDVLYLLDRFNARPVVGSGLSLQLRFTDPQVLAATRLYIDLLQSSSPHSRISSYRHNDFVPDTIIDLVEQGQVGMWFGALDTMGSGAELPFQRAIASRPRGAGALGYGDYSVEGLYITANAQNPAACWEWLTYLSNDVSRMDRPDAFPARLSVAQSETFLSGVPPGARELYSAHLDALLRTPPESRSPFELLADEPEGVDAYWFFRALDRALQGADLERELEEAQFITEQFMACRQGGERWRACALAVDPEYQGYALWLTSEE
jgi:ABC-type glycerol-3-phosphate transport system substrate-binding protein